MDKTLVLKNMSNFPSAFLNVDNNEEESAKNSVHIINNKTATYIKELSIIAFV